MHHGKASTVITLVHVAIAAVLGTIAGVIAYVIGAEDPWPYVIAGLVFLAYFGVFVVIIDGDVF